jgi:dienelactone hydrolase
VAGVVSRPGYRIEKIVYSTLPGVQVPAHLYLPERMVGPAPAVLFYSGHWWPDAKSRPDFQAFCINMARLGFVVLSFDPFGQGERGISTRDHRRVEGLLAGVAQQGFAEYETQCALEYLLSRKEVDPRRVGMTGASGGGYNTWMTAALDDRIAAAVPVVGTSDFFEQIQATRPLDWYRANEHCHFVPGLIRFADNRELLALAAPRPLLIISASQDQSFPVAGVRAVHQYGRALYDSYGANGKIGYFEDSSAGHGYQQKKREAAYGWFLKWLAGKGDGGPFAEPATEIAAFDDPELRCFPAGRNQPAGPGMVAAARALARRMEGRAPWPAWETGAPARLTLRDVALQRVVIPSEPGIDVPAFLLRPAGGSKGLLVAVDDRGKEALAADPGVREALASGWTVCGVDPRGIGELATAKTGWVAAVSLLLGENFVLRQAFDLSRVLEAFSGPVALYARGPAAALAATHAAARHGRLQWLVVREGFLSYRQFLERPASLPLSFRLQTDDRKRLEGYDREIPFLFLPFDGLRYRDLPGLLAQASPNVLVADPVDGDWQRMSEEAARRWLARPIRVVSGDTADARIRDWIRKF